MPELCSSNFRAQALSQGESLQQCGVGQQDQEFLSAPAGSDIGLPDHRAYQFGKVLQGGIAGIVAEVVVYPFEQVQVDQHHREVVPTALVAGEFSSKSAVHVPAVGQAGKFIGTSGFFMAFGQFQQFVSGLQTAGLQHKAENGFEGEGGKKAYLEVSGVFGGYSGQVGKLEYDDRQQIAEQQDGGAALQAGEEKQ